MLFDSDVLIWFLHGNQNAHAKVLQEAPFKISATTYMELLQGVKNKSELAKLKKTLKRLDVEIVHISEEISKKAAVYVEHYGLSNAIEMGDALIAATCIEYDEPLCTANDKHYRVIPDISLDIFRP